MTQRPTPPTGPRKSGQRPPVSGSQRPGQRRPPAIQSPEEPPAHVWLYGIHAVLAALANPNRTHHRLVVTRNGAQHLADRAAPLEPQIVSPDGLSGMLPPGAVHQGLGLLTDPLPEPELEASVFPADLDRPVVVLDRVTDPQNVGAVLRSAAVFNARAVVTTARRSPPITGTLAKAATGAVEHVPYVKVQNLARALERLKEGGYITIGLAEQGSHALSDIGPAGPAAVVLGAEGEGLRPLTRDLCDHLVHIPTPGPLSALNVSNAAAVALYHVVTRSHA